METKLKYVALILLFAWLVIPTETAAQLKMANKEYNNMRYADAIPYYEQCIYKGKRVREARVKLADCYRKIRDYKNAVRLYAELAHEENPTSEDLWLYAGALASDGQYREAAEYYQKYYDRKPNDEQARSFATHYRDIDVLLKDSTSLKVSPVVSINSWQSDFSPMFYGKNLLFLSNRLQEGIVRRVYEYDQSPFLDYYIAEDTTAIHTDLKTIHATYVVNKDKDKHVDETYYTSNDSNVPGSYGGTFLHDSIRYMNEMNTKVRRLQGGANKKWHEGPATFFKGQDTVIFTRSAPRQGGISRLALYTATIEQGAWGDPALLPFNNDKSSSGHPAFTPDNKTLYFISDRPGGAGGTDIYRVNYDNGVWSTPENVAEVNTIHNELFPYVDDSGTLYFSSDGRPGLGGLDIFSATMKEGKVTAITNMGTPVNSSKDDFGIVLYPGSRTGFFSSNRKRGFSDDDIYRLTRTCESVTILAVDAVTRKPISSASVTVDEDMLTTGPDGKVQVCLRPGEHDFSAMKELYEGQKTSSSSTEVTLTLNPVAIGIEGVIISEEDKEPMEGVRIQMVNSAGETVAETTTGRDGKYKFPMVMNETYKIISTKANCGRNTIERTTRGLKKSQLFDGSMSMICTGDIIKVDNIYYDLNKYDIRPDAAAELDKLAEVMWKYPDMRIELRSHTDSRSSSAANMKLSSNRAQAVVEYLAGKGIVSMRMRAAGYGESLPVNKCVDGVSCTEEEYQQNRRTEFTIKRSNRNMIKGQGYQ